MFFLKKGRVAFLSTTPTTNGVAPVRATPPRKAIPPAAKPKPVLNPGTAVSTNFHLRLSKVLSLFLLLRVFFQVFIQIFESLSI